MDVEQILDLVAEFSVGGRNASDADRVLFLKYLNLYKDSLFRKTAAFNDGLYISENIVTSSSIINLDSYEENFNQNLFCIISLIDIENNIELTRLSRPGATLKYGAQKGIPMSYVYVGNEDGEVNIYLYPLLNTPKSYLLTYIKNPSVFVLNSPEIDIPFPKLYHQLLVDGTLWYLFQEVGGFRDNAKSQEARNRCALGEQQLISFLSSQEDQPTTMPGI